MPMAGRQPVSSAIVPMILSVCSTTVRSSSLACSLNLVAVARDTVRQALQFGRAEICIRERRGSPPRQCAGNRCHSVKYEKCLVEQQESAAACFVASEGDN